MRGKSKDWAITSIRQTMTDLILCLTIKRHLTDYTHDVNYDFDGVLKE